MPSQWRDKAYLADILEAIQRINSYIQNMEWEVFLEDDKTRDAVVRNLEIVGEATKNLSTEIKIAYPQIPWKDMARMRDRLIHHYFAVNYEIVWNIVIKELPVLAPQIEAILAYPSE